jgi:Acetyltransferase (GNAT) domain
MRVPMAASQAAATRAYRVSLDPLPEHDALRVMWRQVEAGSKCSFFTSWAWIGPWLARICPSRYARLVSVHLGPRLVAMGVFTERRRFMGMGPMHLRLHEMGDDILDSLTIEYNGLVCEHGHEQAATSAVLDYFIHNDPRWLTLYLPGMASDDVQVDPMQAPGFSSRMQQRAACYVDLASLRDNGQDYMATVLSSKARGAVRRTARKLANQHGDISVSIAADSEQKLAYFHAMAGLHQAYWKDGSDGHGAFGDPRIVRFHEQLIMESTTTEGPELIRMNAGTEVIGYVYNLVWRDTVYFYQSGIDYARFGASGSPGLLLLVHAIERSLADGRSRFELMAGDSAYKQTLAMAQSTMAWISLDRAGWVSRLRHAWWTLKRGPR